ncbi:MAG: hypothetical protein NT096_00105 [Proteobacteria bacterium]|nr:hypothetical protein [Pseudomonadota bacterium]
MKDFLQKFMEVAKQNLLKDGNLAAVIMWFRDGQLIGTPQLHKDFECPTAEENKDKNILFAGYTAKILQADTVVFIWDAAMRAMNPNQTYDGTESPLTYPESMRTECIMIEAIKVPSGKDEFLITPYKGGNGKPVEFLPEILDLSNFKSRIAGVLLAGYNSANRIII